MSRPQTSRTATAANKTDESTSSSQDGASKPWLKNGTTIIPSTRTAAGKEAFLQTPAHIIAGQYSRGDSVAKQNKVKALSGQLSKEQRFSSQLRKTGYEQEQELNRAKMDVSNLKHENAQLWSKCENLSRQLLRAQREAKETQEATSLLNQQLQNLKTSHKGTQVMELRADLREAHMEIERLNEVVALIMEKQKKKQAQ